MNSKKVFFGMIGLLVFTCVLIIGIVVLGDKTLRNQSGKLVSLKLEHEIIESQQSALKQAKRDIQKYSELEAVAKQIVPQDKDQARATREIINLAAQSGVRIASIGFPSSTLGQPTAKPAVPASDDAPKTAVPAAPSVTQVKPVKGIANLFQLDITVVSDTTSPATYPKLVDFLSRLEKNRRTAQVSQISIQPDALNRNALNFTLNITLYIKP